MLPTSLARGALRGGAQLGAIGLRPGPLIVIYKTQGTTAIKTQEVDFALFRVVEQ